MKKILPSKGFSYLVIFLTLFSCTTNEPLDQQLLDDNEKLIKDFSSECRTELIQVVTIYNTKSEEWRESPETVKANFKEKMRKYFTITKVSKTGCVEIELWEVNCEEFAKYTNTNEEDEAEAEVKRLDEYVDENGCLK